MKPVDEEKMIPFEHIIIDDRGPNNPHIKVVGDIDGDGFVDVVIPSATPSDLSKPIPSQTPVYRSKVRAYSNGLIPYSETLSKTLNEWAEQAQSKVRVSIAGGAHYASDMVCLTVELTSEAQPFRKETPSEESILAIAKLAESEASRIGCLDYLRGIVAFSGSKIHIFKPTALIGWTRTAALTDAAEIYARIADARYAMREINA